jgi:hypothetical protein
MADYTNTGYQANVSGGGGGSGSSGYKINGKWVLSSSPEGQRYRANQNQMLLRNSQQRLQQTLGAQTNLATAEVEADAQDYEAQQNREAGQQAFQYAMSQSGNRRQPGGGIARGGSGRRGMTLNQATGGLAAANAAARKKAQMGLAQARVAADPQNIAMQSSLNMVNRNLRQSTSANRVSVPRIGS